MSRPVTIAILTCLATGFVIVLLLNTKPNAQADPPPVAAARVTPITKAPGSLMRAKLTSSKKVLEGLLRRDYQAIAQGAREMKRISEAAEWPRARDAVYEHHSMEFRRQCNQLESLAQKMNHEGVQFTYLSMTSTCIHCHDYVRDALRVADSGRRADVQLIPSQWPEQATGGKP